MAAGGAGPWALAFACYLPALFYHPRHYIPVNYPDFEARWRPAGGAERANYGLFLQDLCELLGVPRPDPTTDLPAQDAYVLERAVQFNDGGKRSTGRIDLYKRGCFILETKQGVNSVNEEFNHWEKTHAHDLDLKNLEPRTSNLEPRTSNLEPRTSNLEPRTSNLEPQPA
jgi:hypothetical protein